MVSALTSASCSTSLDVCSLLGVVTNPTVVRVFCDMDLLERLATRVAALQVGSRETNGDVLISCRLRTILTSSLFVRVDALSPYYEVPNQHIFN